MRKFAKMSDLVWIGALLLGAAREKRRHFRRDKAAPAEPWRGEAAGVGIHGRGTGYNTLQTPAAMPSTSAASMAMEVRVRLANAPGSVDPDDTRARASPAPKGSKRRRARG